MYIACSKTEPRVGFLIIGLKGRTVFSVRLTHISTFRPKIFKGRLVNKLIAKYFGYALIKVETQPVTTYPKNVYRWLQQKSTGIVYKVYGLGNEDNVSKLVKGNRILISRAGVFGVNVFDYEDFVEFDFS